MTASGPGELRTRLRQPPLAPLPWAGPDERCALGHTVGPFLELSDGMLIGDCLHCPARFVATWFHGGTAAPLAEVMIREAISIESPAASVLDDLDQLAGLITADLAELARLKRLVGKVRRTVLNRLHRAQR